MNLEMYKISVEEIQLHPLDLVIVLNVNNFIKLLLETRTPPSDEWLIGFLKIVFLLISSDWREVWLCW